MHPIPATSLATVADLQRGNWAGLSALGGTLVRIRHAGETRNGVRRIEWDHGHGTRITVRCLPVSNPVQLSWA